MCKQNVVRIFGFRYFFLFWLNNNAMKGRQNLESLKSTISHHLQKNSSHFPSLGAWFSLLSILTKALEIPISKVAFSADSRGWTDQPRVTRSNPHVNRFGVVSSDQAHAHTIRAWPCRDDLRRNKSKNSSTVFCVWPPAWLFLFDRSLFVLYDCEFSCYDYEGLRPTAFEACKKAVSTVLFQSSPKTFQLVKCIL